MAFLGNIKKLFFQFSSKVIPQCYAFDYVFLQQLWGRTKCIRTTYNKGRIRPKVTVMIITYWSQNSLFLALLNDKTANIHFTFKYSGYSLTNGISGFDHIYINFYVDRT